MPPEQWRVEMFGGIQVKFQGRNLTHFEMRRSGALLARLSYWPKRTHSREELTEMLWPEEDPEVTRQRFRQVLSTLRRALQSLDESCDGFLLADRMSLRLDAGLVATDVAEFEQAVRTGTQAADPQERVTHLLEAVRLYRGELLPGYYDDWIPAERGRLAETYIEVLCRLATTQAEIGDLDGALTHARRAVAADPLREESHCDLMRVYAAAGRPSEAMRQYRELERLLWKEMRSLPSAEVQALDQALRSATPTDASSSLLSVRATTGSAADSTPAAPANLPTSLPRPLTRFFGREDEITALHSLLQPAANDAGAHATRLVTLIGPGGSGKTRLALEVARRLEADFDTVQFVAFDAIQEAGLVARTIAATLSGERSTIEQPLEQIAGALQDRSCLLVLDNLEHLVAEGGTVIRTLLERVPGLSCLVTSRQRLHIEGEQEQNVLPLPVPAKEAAIEEGESVPSLQLFLDRIRQVRPAFVLSADNIATVAAVCRKLEGLPLAIELTAAWASILSPDQMLQRLERRFDLLVSRRQDQAERHQSLHETISWSYRQLTPSLQAFFRRLSVFRGGWTLEAAEALASHKSKLLADLDALRERSLIQAYDTGTEMRFTMLETLREFAEEQLTEEERVTAQRAHTGIYLDLAERAEEHLDRADHLLWLTRLRLEQDNLRAVLRNGLATEADKSVRLACALFRYWELSAHYSEAETWLDTMLNSGAELAPPVRAKALEVAGNLALGRRQPTLAVARLEESLALYQSLNDVRSEARATCVLGIAMRDCGDLARAAALLGACQPSLRATRDVFTLARALGGLAITVKLEGDATG
ncbi:MAG: putative ATPase, partial [Chthonomonadales bacterium]|nr:putative ATPase [Chthonomonadales bacterium]